MTLCLQLTCGKKIEEKLNMKNMDILKPGILKKGDKIGIISPASKPSDESRYFKGVQYLEELGYSVISGKSVLNQRGYLAGEDINRINDLNFMFADPEIKAVFCSRGGYGVPRILDQVDYEAIKKNPKIFVGYSDITALNLAILAKTKLVTFTGPMVAVEMGKGIHEYSESNFWQNFTNATEFKKFENPADEKLKIITPGKAEGRLVAGCLSVFVGLLGTPYMPDLTGAILVLEDIDEEPYRLDRYFAQLKLSGIFDNISGLIFGQFIDCTSKDQSKPSLTIEEVIQDYVKNLNIPIIANFAYGHGAIKLTLPIGVQARLDTAEDGLTILEKVIEL